MSKEKDKILRTLEHIAITFDKFGFSPTIPICTGHKDFNYLFRLEIDTIKELCEQQSQRIAELEKQLVKNLEQKVDQAKTEFAIEQLKFIRGIITFPPPLETKEEIMRTFIDAINDKIYELKEVKNV